MIIGINALNSEFIWQDLYAQWRDHGQNRLLIEGLRGIDIALWNIRGKYFNVSAYQLLGGAMCTEVHAYATGLYHHDSGDPLSCLVEEAEAMWSRDLRR